MPSRTALLGPFCDSNRSKRSLQNVAEGFEIRTPSDHLTGATTDLKSCTFFKDLSVAELVHTYVSTASLLNQPRAFTFSKAAQSHCLKPLFLLDHTVGPRACCKEHGRQRTQKSKVLESQKTVLNLLTYNTRHLHCAVFCTSAFILIVRIHYSGFASVPVSTLDVVLSRQNFLQ